MRHLLFGAIRAAVLCCLLALLTMPRTAGADGKPSGEEVGIYRSLFTSSMIRNIRFDQQEDPEESAREEIYLSGSLAEDGRKAGLESDRDLMSEVDMSQMQFLLNKLMNLLVEIPTVPREKVEAAYKENLSVYTTKPSVTFQHLFLLVPPGDTSSEAKKKELAGEISSKAKKGAEFSHLVGEYSELRGAREGNGKVGPVNPEKLNETMKSAVAALKEGEISDPVRTPYGWEIVRLIKREDATARPLADVYKDVESSLLQTQVGEAQKSLTDKVRAAHPVEINEALLDSEGEIDGSSWLLRIDGRELTADEVVRSINLMDPLDKHTPREKLKAGLDRIVLTEQMREFARENGILDRPDVQTGFRFIRDRLVGERYFNHFFLDEQPHDDVLRSYYDEDPTRFSTPPRIKGKRLDWMLGDEDLSDSQRKFRAAAIRTKITPELEKVRSGELSREEFERTADRVIDLDWFPEGPMGYTSDMAFFKTEKGHYTEPFELRNQVSIGWVEDKVERTPIPFDEIKDNVKRRYLIEKSRKVRDEKVEAILKEYAALP